MIPTLIFNMPPLEPTISAYAILQLLYFIYMLASIFIWVLLHEEFREIKKLLEEIGDTLKEAIEK